MPQSGTFILIWCTYLCALHRRNTDGIEQLLYKTHSVHLNRDHHLSIAYSILEHTLTHKSMETRSESEGRHPSVLGRLPYCTLEMTCVNKAMHVSCTEMQWKVLSSEDVVAQCEGKGGEVFGIGGLHGTSPSNLDRRHLTMKSRCGYKSHLHISLSRLLLLASRKWASRSETKWFVHLEVRRRHDSGGQTRRALPTLEWVTQEQSTSWRTQQMLQCQASSYHHVHHLMIAKTARIGCKDWT